MGQELGVTPHMRLTRSVIVLAQARFYQSQQEELQFILRQLLTHDFYSVLPELNQTPKYVVRDLAIRQNQMIGQTLMRQNSLLGLGMTLLR